MLQKIMNFFQNKYFQKILLAILILYQIIRLLTFVNIYGGVEHDAGWLLGVARSLAERAIYATMVSTMSDPAIMAGLDMNQQFYQIQDEDGRVYFFAEGTTGPTQIVPDAIFIKVFGSGFWQFRVASLLFYLVFLLLASWLLFSVGGFWAAFLFHSILFFYPHLSVFLGYESLGEVPAVTCILFSYIFFTKAANAQNNRIRWFILSGLMAGLAMMAKLIALLALSSLGLLWLILFLQKRVTFKEGLITSLAALCFPLAWELTQLVAITKRLGFEVYLQHVQGRLNIFLVEGSGLGEQATEKQAFFWYKFFLISEISHPHRVLSFMTIILIFIGGAFLIWRLRKNRIHQNLVILLWVGWLVHTVWFVTTSENGWVRHFWASLILAVLILSLLWGILLRHVQTQPVWLNSALAIGMTLLIGLNFYSQWPAATFLMSDNLVEHWYEKHLAADHTRIPWSLVPRQTQQDAVDFISKLPPTARVFYPEGHKSAEMAVLTARVFYPIQRRALMPPNEDDIVLIGPSLISPWRKPTETHISQADQHAFITEVMKQVKRECPDIIFENNYYIICALN
jgi:hypothetical protein